MTRLTPTMHPDHPIGLRVEAEIEPGLIVQGRVVGVSYVHAIFTYIVLLDKPLEVPGWEWPWEAIPVHGGLIKPIGAQPLRAAHAEAVVPTLTESERLQIKEALHLVCCPFGTCNRRLGHKGAHGDPFDKHDDDVVTGRNNDRPTAYGVQALRELCDMAGSFV